MKFWKLLLVLSLVLGTSAAQAGWLFGPPNPDRVERWYGIRPVPAPAAVTYSTVYVPVAPVYVPPVRTTVVYPTTTWYYYESPRTVREYRSVLVPVNPPAVMEPAGK